MIQYNDMRIATDRASLSRRAKEPERTLAPTNAMNAKMEADE